MGPPPMGPHPMGVKGRLPPENAFYGNCRDKFPKFYRMTKDTKIRTLPRADVVTEEMGPKGLTYTLVYSEKYLTLPSKTAITTPG